MFIHWFSVFIVIVLNQQLRVRSTCLNPSMTSYGLNALKSTSFVVSDVAYIASIGDVTHVSVVNARIARIDDAQAQEQHQCDNFRWRKQAATTDGATTKLDCKLCFETSSNRSRRWWVSLITSPISLISCKFCTLKLTWNLHCSPNFLHTKED